MGIFGILGTPLGYVLKWMYDFLGSYGWALVVFTVAVRLLSFPLQIKQQKNTARMAAYQPMIADIQKKYAKDKEKQSEELMKLQEEYGFNPAGGCLPMFLNFFVMFGVIEAVYYPMQHILHLGKDVIKTVADALGKNMDIYFQSHLIQAIQKGEHMDVIGGILSPEQIQSVRDFNVMFMGMDLTMKPSLSGEVLGAGGWILLLFPILSIITMACTNVLTMKMSGQEMQGAMKWMPWMMSLMFVWISFTVPVAFSLYYTVSNLLMMVQAIVLKKIYDPEKFKQQLQEEIEAKKKAKKAKKQIKTVDESGKEVVKSVTEAEMNRYRIELARKQDEEKYKDERTVPLSELKSKEE